MKRISFGGSLLLLGCGAVSKCLQQLLAQVDLDFTRLIIIDSKDYKEEIQATIERGATFLQKTVNRENFASIFKDYLKAGDMVIDLATGIPSIDLIDWCQEHKVLFLNTSLEWPSKLYPSKSIHQENTIYSHHVKLQQAARKWDKRGPTAIIEHGANPGLVSHWTKVALEDISQRILAKGTGKERAHALEKALEEGNYPLLSLLTGTKVIHIAERDTQITSKPKRVNEFVNTWSVVGFYEEAMLPSELGWGTHEKIIPGVVKEHSQGPRNEVYLTSFGLNTFVYSWVPTGQTIGMLVSHGESFTISDYLTVWHDTEVLYRPSVYFVYVPCDGAFTSLAEVKMRNYELQKEQRILNDDIVDGYDQMGVLLLGHDFNGWWMGSTLDIHQTRQLVGPGHNPTTLQVAASMLGVLFWMIQNPSQGLCMPDDIPHQEVLSIANPYLGTLSSVQTDWQPPVKKVQWLLEDFIFSLKI